MEKIELLLLWLILKQKIKEVDKNRSRFVPVLEAGYRPGTCRAEAELIEAQREDHIKRFNKERNALQDRLTEVRKILKDTWLIEI